MTKRLTIVPLSLTALLAALPAHARCEKSDEIERAFRPNIDYHASRAGISPSRVQRRMTKIEDQDLGCAELYQEYEDYLDLVKRQRTKSQFLFKKW